MRPDDTMGAFLEVWRTDWLGWSRERLARAVSARCVNGKQVMMEMVRGWESGQPPNTYAEVEALSLILRRYGFSKREARQFVAVVDEAVVAK
jgi:hypothetical protein